MVAELGHSDLLPVYESNFAEIPVYESNFAEMPISFTKNSKKYKTNIIL